MKLYIICGDQSNEIADYLSGSFEVLGCERTLEAACYNVQKMSSSPEAFLVFGSPVVTGFTEEGINYANALIKNLKELRLQCPESNIKVIISPKVKRDIIDNIVQMGIYDIYQADELSMQQLPDIIRTNKTIANYQESISTAKLESKLSSEDKNVEVFNEEESSEDKKNKRSKGIFQTIKKGKELFSRRKNNQEVVYVSHPLVAVWNPTGSMKSETALKIAAAAARMDFNTALVEFDLTAPLLDIHFKVPQTRIDEIGNDVKGAGIMTLGENLGSEYIPKLLQKTKWKILYLAGGNKLGNIGTPEYSTEQMKQVLQAVYHRELNKKPAATVVNTGSCFELAPTFAALQLASVVVIPLTSTQEAELAKQQINELNRVGINPHTVEVVWGAEKVKQVCDTRINISPECSNPFELDREKQQEWQEVFNQLV